MPLRAGNPDLSGRRVTIPLRVLHVGVERPDVAQNDRPTSQERVGHDLQDHRPQLPGGRQVDERQRVIVLSELVDRLGELLAVQAVESLSTFVLTRSPRRTIATGGCFGLSTRTTCSRCANHGASSARKSA